MFARQLSTDTIEALMRVAACCSVVRHEAEDLVQDVLLAAIEKGRDCGDASFLPWAAGAIRNRARFVARTAVRRKRREHTYSVEHERSPHSSPRFPDTFVITLPRSRRVVALLINLGMGRREIAYLLGLPTWRSVSGSQASEKPSPHLPGKSKAILTRHSRQMG
jgi:RNA polymerase sigma-70 factor (ECF subfamily)